MLFAVASAFAQWTKPTISGTEPANGEKVYIVNTDVCKFFVGTQTIFSWSTTAGVADEGLLVTLTERSEGEGVYNLVRADGKHTFRSAVGELHVDMGSQGHDAFVFDKQANGYYYIRSAADDDLYGEAVEGYDYNLVWGLNPSRHAIHIYPDTDPTDPEAHCNWAFVTEEDYASLKVALNTYAAAEALKAALDKAKADYPNADFSAVEAVYNNTESTKAELDQAVKDIDAIIRAYVLAEAVKNSTVANPTDVTAFIVNPSFETGNYNGWTTKTSADTGAKANSNDTYHCDNADGDYVFNTWDHGYPVTQVIKDIPNGIYQLKALLASEKDCQVMYLLGGADHKRFELEVHPEDPGDGSLQKKWFTQASMLVRVDADSIFIGAVGPNNDAERSYVADGLWWYKADKFELAYLGAGDDAMQLWRDDVAAGMVEFTDDDLVTVSIKEEYNSKLAALKEAATAADIVAAYEALVAMDETVTANKKAWQAYQEALELANTVTSEENIDSEAEAVGVLSDYLMESEDIINNKELTTEQLAEEIAKVDELRKAAMQCFKEGVDFTHFLKNPAFTGSANGWQGSPAVNSDCGEKYGLNADFDVYQEVADVPVGLYEISMQGFYREYRDDDTGKTAWYNIFESTEDARTYKPSHNILSYVYMNSSKTPMNCVYDYAKEAEVDENGVVQSAYYGSGFSVDPYNKYVYPNNMANAAKAFGDGAYKVSAYGIVAKDGDKMRIGVKGHLGGSDWAIFDNFVLTYRAKSPVVINKLLPEAIAALDLNRKMGSDVKETVAKAVAAAENAATNDEKFAALASIYDASEMVDASVALFTNLAASLETLATAIGDAVAGESVQTEASNLYDEVEAAINDGTYTDAEAKEAMEKIEAMKTALATPDTSNASDEDPVDMTSLIKDAAFTGLSVSGDKYGAWTWTKNGGNGPTFSGAFEFWNGSASALRFTLDQTIANLPVGTYSMKADAANSFNGQEPGTNGGRAALYALVGETTSYNAVTIEPKADEATAYDSYEVIFKVTEAGQNVKIGFMSVGTMDARWFSGDNFTLKYFGTESAHEVTPDGIAALTGISAITSNENVGASTIFTTGATRVATLQKGINIVRMANGKIVKVLVK